MKKKAGLVLLLVAVVAVLAFASERVSFRVTGNGQFGEVPEGIQVNWVEYGSFGGYVNYTVTGNVDSLKIVLTLTYTNIWGTHTTSRSNNESWISKGKTYTAKFPGFSSNLNVTGAEVTLENVVYK